MYEDREIEKKQKKACRIVIKELKRLTESQKVRRNILLWEQFMALPELNDVLLYTPFHIEARNLIVPFSDIPLDIQRQLYNRLKDALGYNPVIAKEEMRQLLEVLKMHIRFETERSQMYQSKDEFTQVREWLSKYYHVLNSEKAKDIEYLRAFFDTDEYKAIKHHDSVLDKLNIYYYSQANYTKELMQVLYEVYNFKDFDRTMDWKRGHIALYRTLKPHVAAVGIAKSEPKYVNSHTANKCSIYLD